MNPILIGNKLILNMITSRGIIIFCFLFYYIVNTFKFILQVTVEVEFLIRDLNKLDNFSFFAYG